MKYFRNTELAKLYKVSEKSVRNWIDAAQAGKLDLQLYKHNGKEFVANTTKNTRTIEQLVQKGKKFRNTRGFKALTPTEEFYTTYNGRQIIDIISGFTYRKELPLHYGYFDGGATAWDKYANRLGAEEASNILTSTQRLMDLNAAYFDQLLGNAKVNIVDLGPGNGLPIKNTLERLVSAGKLNRYVAIDLSQQMLDIVKANIDKWFGGQIAAEYHVRNFAEELFDDLLIRDENGNYDDQTPNLVCLFGGTLSNFGHPEHALHVINSSMRSGDILLNSGYVDTPYIRRYFDLSGGNSGLVPRLLNIDESLCEFVVSYDPQKNARFRHMIPKVDLAIHFKLSDDSIRAVELEKGEPVLLWRHQHYNTDGITKLLSDNGFDVMQATKSSDGNYALVASRVQTHNLSVQ